MTEHIQALPGTGSPDNAASSDSLFSVYHHWLNSSNTGRVVGATLLTIITANEEPSAIHSRVECRFCKQSFVEARELLLHLPSCPHIPSNTNRIKTSLESSHFPASTQHHSESPTHNIRDTIKRLFRGRTGSKASSHTSTDSDGSWSPCDVEGSAHGVPSKSAITGLTDCPPSFCQSFGSSGDLAPTACTEAVPNIPNLRYELPSGGEVGHSGMEQYLSFGFPEASALPAELGEAPIEIGWSQREETRCNAPDSPQLSPLTSQNTRPDWHISLGDACTTTIPEETSKDSVPLESIYAHVPPLDVIRRCDDTFVVLQTPVLPHGAPCPVDSQGVESDYEVAIEPSHLLEDAISGILWELEQGCSVAERSSISTSDSYGISPLTEQPSCGSRGSWACIPSPLTIHEPEITSQQTKLSPHDSQTALETQDYRCLVPGCSYEPQGKPENWAKNLRKHRNNKHNAFMVYCLDCKRPFTRRDNMNHHRKNSCPMACSVASRKSRPKRNADEETSGEEGDAKRKKHHRDCSDDLSLLVTDDLDNDETWRL